MKKIFICLALLISFFMVSCQTPAEESINELEMIVEMVEADCEYYTLEDYEMLAEELEEFKVNYADVEYTPEQQQRLEELNVKLASIISENMKGKMNNAVEDFIGGFMNVANFLNLF